MMVFGAFLLRFQKMLLHVAYAVITMVTLMMIFTEAVIVMDPIRSSPLLRAGNLVRSINETY